MKLKESEHEIQTAIIGYLQYKKFFVMRLNSGKIPITDRYGKRRLINLLPSGTPDLMAIKNGRCYFFEVKVPGGKVTILQNAKMQELEEYGAECYIVHSVAEVEHCV